MTQDEINAVKKAAEKMRKQESAQDEIIEMAREVGLVIDGNQSGLDDLQAFANLVAAKEREACAKVCEKITNDLSNWPESFCGVTSETKFMRSMGEIVGQPFIEAIRARGEA